MRLTKSGKIDKAIEIQSKADEVARKMSEESVTAEKNQARQEVQIWIDKAKEQFPALSDPKSEISLKIQKLKKEKAGDSEFFSNSRWPYLLAMEANESLRKLDAAALNASPSSSYPANEFYRMVGTNGVMYVGSRGGTCVCRFKAIESSLHPKGSLVLVSLTKNDPYAGTPDDVLIHKGKSGPVVARAKWLDKSRTYKIPLDLSPSNDVALEIEVLHPDGLKLKAASDSVPDMFLEIQNE